MDQGELSRIMREILSNDLISIRTKDFVRDLQSKLMSLGRLSEKQMEALVQVADRVGIDMNRSPQTQTTNNQVPAFEIVKGSCGICHNGLVLAFEIESKAKYVFRCSCKIGAKRRELFPSWTSFLGNQYLVDKPD